MWIQAIFSGWTVKELNENMVTVPQTVVNMAISKWHNDAPELRSAIPACMQSKGQLP